MDTPSREMILGMLDKFMRQRPGLEFGNYGDIKAYRSELRGITKDFGTARTLLRAVELSSITAEELMDAFRAYSGRLTLTKREKDGKWVLDYCTGQYWPTEYRAAVCAVLASALWAHKRDHCMPAPVYHVGDGKKFATMKEASDYCESKAPDYILAIEERYGKGITAGDWLRSSFKREFGRGIQSRWFD